MQEHCHAIHMPRKAGAPPKLLQFTIALPEQAIAMMKELQVGGLHGPSRGEIARKLIFDQLTYLQGRGIVKPRSLGARRSKRRK
jgi:hypothetical protein